MERPAHRAGVCEPLKSEKPKIRFYVHHICGHVDWYEVGEAAQQENTEALLRESECLECWMDRAKERKKRELHRATSDG